MGDHDFAFVGRQCGQRQGSPEAKGYQGTVRFFIRDLFCYGV